MRKAFDRRTVSRNVPTMALLLALALVATLLGFASPPAAAQANQDSFLVVRAAGRSGGENLVVQVNGSTVGTVSLDGSPSLTAAPDWKNYFFAVSSSVTASDVTILYTNDWGLGSDVRVDHIRLHNETFETEAPGVITRGGWGNGANCQTGEFQTDYLACSGQIDYRSTTGGQLVVVLAGQTGDELVNLRISGAYIDTLSPTASGSSFRSNPAWSEFRFDVASSVTASQITLQFFNDYRSGGYDRNVRVDKIVLHGQVFETEAPDVRTSGSWAGGRCSSGSFGTETLVCNGEVHYGDTPSGDDGDDGDDGGDPTPDGSARELAEDTKNRLSKTMNLGNALEAPSFEGEWGMVIEDWMFPTIKQAGFSAVRIPIRWSAHALDNAPYTIDADWFARVDHVIEQARINDLAVVINMHHYDELNSNPFGHRDRFLGMWEQIARRYQNLPQTVSFELLNEPNGAIEPYWNDFAAASLDVVRESNPNRTVLIGPTGYNKLTRLQDLVLPADENLVLSVHYYEPFDVTHQQASWVTFDNGDLIFPDNKTCCDATVENQIHADMVSIAAWADARNRPVIIGEFGVLDHADNATRVDWTAHFRWRSQDEGFAWAYWEFGEGFGVFDPATCQWNESLHEALLPFYEGSLDVDGVGCR